MLPTSYNSIFDVIQAIIAVNTFNNFSCSVFSGDKFCLFHLIEFLRHYYREPAMENYPFFDRKTMILHQRAKNLFNGWSLKILLTVFLRQEQLWTLF